ncbi:MAG: PorP/SprF family type IX secretion system membrane protein [Flavobacteriales bacterium]
MKQRFPMFKLSLMIGVCAMITSSLYAQDIHFTQWTNATQTYNPALTGEFQQNVKGTLLHKRQWRSIGEGYTTNGLDAQYKMLSWYNDNYAGFGLNVLQDRAGIAEMRTFSIMGSAAQHLIANRKNLLSAGAQVGFVQRSVDIDGLRWDAQFNGVAYDPSLDDKEKLLTTKDGNLDIGCGINWRHKGRKRFALGYAILHTSQQITYYPRGSDKLRLRQTWHGSLWKDYEFFSVRYDALVQRQGGAMEIVTGITFDSKLGLDSRYTTNQTSNSVKGGIFWRYRDCLHPFIGFEFRHFAAATIGFDVRTRKIPTATSFVGGPEISLIYLGSFERRRMKLMK